MKSEYSNELVTSPRSSIRSMGIVDRDEDANIENIENISTVSSASGKTTHTTMTVSELRREQEYKIPETSSGGNSRDRISINLVPLEPTNPTNIKESWDTLSKEELVNKFNCLATRWLTPFQDISEVMKVSCIDDINKSCYGIVQLGVRNFQLGTFDSASISKGYKTCLYEGMFLYYEFKKEEMMNDIEETTKVTYLLLFNKIMEIIHYCKQALHGLLRTRIAIDPDYDYSMNDDISLFRFSPVDYSKNSPYQNLLLYLLSSLYQKGYRRYKDLCYKRRFNQRGCFTYAWREVSVIQDFVYESTQKEINFQQWHNSTINPSNIEKVVKHLTNCRDKEFQEVRKNRHVFSFRNGVYMSKCEGPNGELIDGFFRFGTHPSLASNVVASKYFDMDFEDFGMFKGEYPKQSTLERINDETWYEDIPTPNFQKILEYQFGEFSDYHDISKWMYRLIGRMLYDVGECDSWQVFPYFQGIAGTGKGTLLKIPALFYEPSDVATLENTTEKVFGLEAIHDKYVFIAAELKSNLNIDQTTFQKMISGEDVSVAAKNKTAKSVIWKTPGAGAGNTTIFQDNSGSISRRFVTFMFKKKIRKGEGDPMLEKKLQGEIGRLLLKCNRAYCSAVNKYARKDLWNVLPKYFLDIKDVISQETNVIKNFLSSGKLMFGKDYFCMQKDFKVAFNVHCQENNLGKFTMAPSICDEPFGEFSEKYGTDIKFEKNFNRLVDGVRIAGSVIVGLKLKGYGDEDNECEFDEVEIGSGSNKRRNTNLDL